MSEVVLCEEPIELQSIRAICDTEFGIGRVGDAGIRKKLYQRLIDVAPGERIPWHRLIQELLREGNSEEAEITIKNAVAAVGNDGPIDRFKVRLLVVRARNAKGISSSDRLAMLRRAYEQAMRNIAHHKMDKHSYRVLCDVAVEMIQFGEPPYILDEAIAQMREAASRILDSDLDDTLREYERHRSRLH